MTHSFPTRRVSDLELRRTTDSLEVAGDQVLKAKPLSCLMAFVRKWALITNSRDNISHYFRGLFHVTPKALNMLLGAPVVPELLTPGEREDGNSNPDEVLPDLPGLDPGALDGLLSPDGNILEGILGNLAPGPSKKSAKDSSSRTSKSATGLNDQKANGRA